MVYGILSDIHGNLDALLTALDFLNQLKIDKFIILGDIIGYGPQPNECISEIQKLINPVIILGNHDAAITGRVELKYFNDYARKALIWTKKVLDNKSILFLTKASDKISENELLFVHGSPREPTIEYLINYNDFFENLIFFKEKICFVGHTHVPVVFESQKGISEPENEMILNKNKKYIINVGSIGQPRDSDNRLSFMIFDDNNYILKYFRLKYDIPAVQKKMSDTPEIPEYLKQRLAYGK